MNNNEIVKGIFLEAFREGKKKGMSDEDAVKYADMVIRRMGWWKSRDGEWYKSKGKKIGVA